MTDNNKNKADTSFTISQPIIQTCKLNQITDVADGTVEAKFTVEQPPFLFTPGQYVRITNPNTPQDSVGGNTRDFSIADISKDNSILSIVFRNSESQFKQDLVNSKPGSKFTLQGPLGSFVLPTDLIPVVFIAGGIGITPFIAMIRSAILSKSERRIDIVYTNASEERAVYLNELREYANQNKNINLIENIGELSIDRIREFPIEKNALWYICGPSGFVLDLRSKLTGKMDIDPKNIRTEEYIGYSTKTNYKILEPTTDTITELSLNDLSDASITESFLGAVGLNSLVSITDQQGTIIYINQKFIDISKYDVSELIGQNHRVLKSGHHPPSFYEKLWRTISSGETWRGEIKNRAKDGSFYWVDSVIVPVLDKNKKPKKYLAVRTLINDKKDLEDTREATLNLLEDIDKEKEQARLEQERVSTILFGIGDGVFVMDQNKKLTLINKVAEDLSGFSADDAMGKLYNEVFNFVIEGTNNPNIDFIDRVFSTGKTYEMAKNTEMLRPDGKSIPVSDSAAPLKDSDGNVIGVVVVFRDVTHERSVDKAKTEFVSLASHQLRTPLTSIKWYTEMLLSGDAGKTTKEQMEYLKEIETGSGRMIDLVGSLLNVSRIELGTFMVQPEMINLSELSDQAIKENQILVAEKDIHIDKKYDPSVPAYNGDKKLVYILFQNLISNAIKYTPNGGSILVSIVPNESFIRICVADSGMGIPKHQQEKIFQKLFRADNAKQSDTTGTGLGLYIVKAIVEQTAKGKLSFASEEGQGTEFCIDLPATGMEAKDGSKPLE